MYLGAELDDPGLPKVSSGSTMLLDVAALVSVALVLGVRDWDTQLWTGTWREKR